MVSAVPRHFLVSYNIVPSIMVRLRKVSIGLSKSHFAMYHFFLGYPVVIILILFESSHEFTGGSDSFRTC